MSRSIILYYYIFIFKQNTELAEKDLSNVNSQRQELEHRIQFISSQLVKEKNEHEETKKSVEYLRDDSEVLYILLLCISKNDHYVNLIKIVQKI